MLAAKYTKFSHGGDRLQIQTALGLLGGAVALLTPLALLAIPHSETVALVGRAGSDTGAVIRVVAAAGGSILGVGGRPNIVIARSDSAGFAGRLYAAGAQLVLDGGLASGCGRPDQADARNRTSHPESGLTKR